MIFQAKKKMIMILNATLDNLSLLQACVSLAKNVGEMRTETELLPQCWEQVNPSANFQSTFCHSDFRNRFLFFWCYEF